MLTRASWVGAETKSTLRNSSRKGRARATRSVQGHKPRVASRIGAQRAESGKSRDEESERGAVRGSRYCQRDSGGLRGLRRSCLGQHPTRLAELDAVSDTWGLGQYAQRIIEQRIHSTKVKFRRTLLGLNRLREPRSSQSPETESISCFRRSGLRSSGSSLGDVSTLMGLQVFHCLDPRGVGSRLKGAR